MSKKQEQSYHGNGAHEFEIVAVEATTFVQRLRVPGGWIYHITSKDLDDNTTTNSVFIPMPEVVVHKV
jgi:hypothetical protein